MSTFHITKRATQIIFASQKGQFIPIDVRMLGDGTAFPLADENPSQVGMGDSASELGGKSFTELDSYD